MATRRRYHHGELRRALLDAALEQIAAHGPDQFTVADAARAAGVSSAAPYRHFESREELLRALGQEGAEKLQELIESAQADADDTPMEQFRALGVAAVVFAAEHPGYHRVLTTPEYAPDGGLGDEARFWRKAAATLRARKRGDDDGAVLFGVAARAMVHGLAMMFVDGHMERIGVPARLARQVADRVTLAIAPGDDEA
ncbi:MAG: TetR family transcriptional regulator [Nannocystaceae bacterium]